MANADEVKLQEKLARVERLETKLSDSIMTIQSAEIRIAAIKKSVKSMQQIIEGFVKADSETAEKLNLQISKVQALESSVFILNTKAEQLKAIQDKQQEFNLAINRIDGALVNFLDRLDRAEHYQKFNASKMEVDSNKAVAAQACNSLQLIVDRLVAQEADTKKSIEGAATTQKSLFGICDEFRLKSSVNENSVTSLSTSLSATKTEMFNKLQKIVVEISEKIDQRIKEKLPDVDVQKIASTVKDLMRIELANISADSTNAYLKYNNIDAQVKLIEKKIETLGLLIKKLELAKQE